ncbi:MAG: hypothetical protein L0027_14195, partial [Candidatus Rokubacteria bacterium]|nr:hypothetical protein [Candidatus Rokubacteria bacterium]
MAKIETAIKEAVARGAGREARRLTLPLRRQVRRLRQHVNQLRRDLKGLVRVAARWERSANHQAAPSPATAEEARTARLSP